MNYGRNNLMVIAAHRYCLGRRTYIVSDCVDWLLGIWSDLDDQTKAIIQRDTEEAFRRDDEDRDGCRENMALGHDCDRRKWEKLRDLWMGAKQEEIPEWVDVDDYEEQKQEPFDMAYRPGGLSMEQAEQEPVAWLWVNEQGSERLEWEPVQDISKWKSTPLYTAPVQQAEQSSDSERIEQVPPGYEYAENLAKDRYKVVPSHPSMFHGFAVTAGDGERHLYVSRKADCENVARILTGAFLDGAFAATYLNAAPVRTKDLTGQDLCDLEIAVGWKGDSHDFDVIVKAAIAKYKEKNRG